MTPEKDALLPVTESDQPTRVEPFHFRRYVGGVERAEGVTIERESTLEAAMRKAAAICPKAPCTVLVLEGLSRRDDAEREGEVEGEELRRAAQAVLDNADRPGSRMHFESGPAGEDMWVDHKEVDQPVLDQLAAALSTTPEPAAVARREDVEGWLHNSGWEGNTDVEQAVREFVALAPAPTEQEADDA